MHDSAMSPCQAGELPFGAVLLQCHQRASQTQSDSAVKQHVLIGVAGDESPNHVT